MKKWIWVVLGMTLFLGMMAGCSNDDDPVIPPETVVLPPSADLLISEFVQVYQGLDGERLAELVHPEARVFLLPSTLAEWAGGIHPLTFTYFDRDSLLAAHENIFTGLAGRDASGNTISPVDSINVDGFEKTGIWEMYPDPGGDFAGLEVYSVIFSVVLYFNNPDLHRFEVNQTLEMYVTEVVEGDPSGWQLLGWRGFDPVSSASTESITWDFILCLYR